MDKKIDQLYQDGKTDKAVHLLVEKIDEKPQQIENYLQLSTYLIEQGSLDQAQKLLEQAQHLVKTPLELNYNLAVVHYLQGDFDQALALLKVIPNDELTLYQKALVYLKLGQGQKALAYALTIKQQDDRVRELIGDIWLSLGQLTQALASYQQIKKPQAKVYFLEAICLLTQDRQKAQNLFAQAQKMDSKYYQQARNQYAGLLELVRKKEAKND